AGADSVTLLMLWMPCGVMTTASIGRPSDIVTPSRAMPPTTVLPRPVAVSAARISAAMPVECCSSCPSCISRIPPPSCCSPVIGRVYDSRCWTFRVVHMSVGVHNVVRVIVVDPSGGYVARGSRVHDYSELHGREVVGADAPRRFD